jgi:hypothetical protein
VKLTTALRALGISYTGLHDAAYDSCITALLFVSEFCGYKVSERDYKFIQTLKAEAQVHKERFKIGDLKTNGKGSEVCLTGFTKDEKMKFSDILIKRGFRIRTSVNPTLRMLVTPSGSYSRSPSKEAEAKRIGAEIIDLNSLLLRINAQ